MLNVNPSGADLTSADVPTMPPAPGWFSTMTGCPSALASAGDAARVIVSTPDAVATGRMNFTGRSPICARSGPVGLSAIAASIAADAPLRAMRAAHESQRTFIEISSDFVDVSRPSRNDALRKELVDLCGRVAEGAQQLACVFPHRRRIDSHARSASLERDR